MTNVVRKQLKAIRKIAISHMASAPEHFKSLVEEIDLSLAEDEAEHLAHIEAMEYVEEFDFDLREIA